MIAIDFDYARPMQLDEALMLLSRDGAIPLAGGQSLVPALSTAAALAAEVKPTLLVDISRLAELRRLEIVNRRLVLGAAVTLAAVAAAQATRSVSLLSDVVLTVASTAVRNRGTLVGNLVSASPNREMPVVMVALGAPFDAQGPRPRSSAIPLRRRCRRVSPTMSTYRLPPSCRTRPMPPRCCPC